MRQQWLKLILLKKLLYIRHNVATLLTTEQQRTLYM